MFRLPKQGTRHTPHAVEAGGGQSMADDPKRVGGRVGGIDLEKEKKITKKGKGKEKKTLAQE